MQKNTQALWCVKDRLQVSDELWLCRAWFWERQWQSLWGQEGRRCSQGGWTGNLSTGKPWKERAPFWQQTPPGRASLPLQKAQGHGWSLLHLPESALTKTERERRRGRTLFEEGSEWKDDGCTQMWSGTWFEAVRLRPDCRIVMSSKKIRNDDRILGNEETCNTKKKQFSKNTNNKKVVL